MTEIVRDIMPEEAKLTQSHEYIIADEENLVRVGISHYAAECLGDVVFIELPETGTRLDKGDTFGTIESVKAASDLYMPVSGEIISVNNHLNDNPGLVNDDCYEQGWMIEVQLSNPAELDELMDAKAYLTLLEQAQ